MIKRKISDSIARSIILYSYLHHKSIFKFTFNALFFDMFTGRLQVRNISKIMMNPDIKEYGYGLFGIYNLLYPTANLSMEHTLMIIMIREMITYDIPAIYCDQIVKEVKYPMVFKYGYITRACSKPSFSYRAAIQSIKPCICNLNLRWYKTSIDYQICRDDISQVEPNKTPDQIIDHLKCRREKLLSTPYLLN